jgi:hypothetical protein
MNKEDIIKKCVSVHSDLYDYSLLPNCDIKVNDKHDIVCKKHGKFKQSLRQHYRGAHCPKCSGENKPQNSPDVNYLKKCIVKYGDTIDYSNTVYKNSRTKITYVCEKHGEITQSPKHHLKKGCPKCSYENKYQPRYKYKDIHHLIKILHDIHDSKYQYEFTELPKPHDHIEIICTKHGKFIKQLHIHKNSKEGCPKCNNILPSKEENIIENILIGYNIYYNKNVRNIIAPKELDFYLPDYNLAIEVNGVYWHSELQGKGKYYHINKTDECEKKEIQLIHINQHLLKTKYDIIISRLKHILGLSQYKIHGRKCRVIKIDNLNTIKKFLNDNHIQGYTHSELSYGLEYNGEIVSIMTFSKSRYNKDYQYELVRFCSKLNYSVIGGANKLLKYFLTNNDVSSIISYADRDWSAGKLYESLGFTFSHNTNPNYSYTKDYLIFESRLKYQKHKLKNILSRYDDTKTEWENMMMNGYDRIWNSGNKVYVKQIK